MSGSKAPSESELGFASSPANIERDHGVGYDSRSIRSMSFRSCSSSLRSSNFTDATSTASGSRT